mmetsp:Transcript_26163/g.87927  ORF Transcript_26163/g.87927 Transcript_26163/m.87927 type:complete len:211 (-) Transcript_26163:148-780(-)
MADELLAQCILIGRDGFPRETVVDRRDDLEHVVLLPRGEVLHDAVQGRGHAREALAKVHRVHHVRDVCVPQVVHALDAVLQRQQRVGGLQHRRRVLHRRHDAKVGRHLADGEPPIKRAALAHLAPRRLGELVCRRRAELDVILGFLVASRGVDVHVQLVAAEVEKGHVQVDRHPVRQCDARAAVGHVAVVDADVVDGRRRGEVADLEEDE